MNDFDQLVHQLTDLQAYIGWTADDALRVRALGPLLRPHFAAIVDDFYAEVNRHETTRSVITGGPAQIARLRATLFQWLEDLFAGEYGTDYLARHWRIGRKHVEIGLPQVYAMAALSRLRNQFSTAICHSQSVPAPELIEALKSLHKLIDLDLALIEEAYDIAYVARQQALERERGDTLFRNVVDSAGCAMLMLRPDHTLVFANAYAMKVADIVVTPQRPRDFITTSVAEADRPLFSSQVERAVAGESVPAFSAWVLRSGGESSQFFWNLRRLAEYEEAPVVLAVGQDLTEINEAQAKALQAERLAAIGQMSAGLAHEARNALQRIQACTEMLEFEVEGNAEALNYVRRTQAAQDELLKLFDEVRGYAGPIKLDLSACRPCEIWREAWQLLTVARRGREATLREDPAGCEQEVRLDHFRMVQLFRILFENALAACSDPVLIELTCQPTLLAGQAAVELRVRDHGPGFTPEQKRRAFEPFYTTKTRGTGLGMAIAERIVAMHHGTIFIGNDWPHGAEIVVVLPIS